MQFLAEQSWPSTRGDLSNSTSRLKHNHIMGLCLSFCLYLCSCYLVVCFCTKNDYQRIFVELNEQVEK